MLLRNITLANCHCHYSTMTIMIRNEMLSFATVQRCGWIVRGARYRCSSTAGLKSVDQLPGPRSWPLVGNIPEMIMNFSKTQEESLFHRWYLKYGPIFKIRTYGKHPTVVVADPESAAAMFRAEGEYPSRGAWKRVSWIYKKNNLPTPMFLADGPEWKKIRSAAAKQIMPRRVNNFITPLNEIADEFLQHVARIRNKEGYVEGIQTAVEKWAFQEKLNVYDDTDQLLKEFREAALNFVASLSKIAIAPPLYKIYATKAYRDHLQSISRVHTFGRKIIKEKLKEAIEKGIVDETKTVGLLEQWLIEGKFTEEEALMQSCDMLSGGIDTTANSTSFTLHEVAKRPDLQDKLYHEIITVLGERKYPTFDDLQKLTLVRNTVKETLRMYPPVHYMSRRIANDAKIQGYHIPAKTLVIFNAYTASRHPEYVEDPNTFKPERWSRESSELNAFVSLPFGFGGKSCYGRRLAELEMYLLISRMVRHFRVSTDQHSLKTYQSSVHQPAEPVRIKLEERSC